MTMLRSMPIPAPLPHAGSQAFLRFDRAPAPILTAMGRGRRELKPWPRGALSLRGRRRAWGKWTRTGRTCLMEISVQPTGIGTRVGGWLVGSISAEGPEAQRWRRPAGGQVATGRTRTRCSGCSSTRSPSRRLPGRGREADGAPPAGILVGSSSGRAKAECWHGRWRHRSSWRVPCNRGMHNEMRPSRWPRLGRSSVL